LYRTKPLFQVRVFYFPSATAEPEEVLRTEKQKATLNPNWLEKAKDKSSLTHSVTMQEDCSIQFKVIDWDRVGSHDPLYGPNLNEQRKEEEREKGKKKEGAEEETVARRKRREEVGPANRDQRRCRVDVRSVTRYDQPGYASGARKILLVSSDQQENEGRAQFVVERETRSPKVRFFFFEILEFVLCAP
jgi:hypothetical protein